MSAGVVQFDIPSQEVASPLVQEGLSHEIPSPKVQDFSSPGALPPVVLEDQLQNVPSPVIQVDPSQVVQYPVVPEECNLVEPHPKLPTSPVVSLLEKESVTVDVTSPELPVNHVMPKRGNHTSHVPRACC